MKVKREPEPAVPPETAPHLIKQEERGNIDDDNDDNNDDDDDGIEIKGDVEKAVPYNCKSSQKASSKKKAMKSDSIMYIYEIERDLPFCPGNAEFYLLIRALVEDGTFTPILQGQATRDILAKQIQNYLEGLDPPWRFCKISEETPMSSGEIRDKIMNALMHEWRSRFFPINGKGEFSWWWCNCHRFGNVLYLMICS